VLNSLVVTYHPKIVDTGMTTLLYDQTNNIFIGAGLSKTLLGPYRDPLTGDPIGGTDIQALVSGVNYLANTLEDGTGTNITADLVIVMTSGASGAQFVVTNNNASGGFLTLLQVYGNGIYDTGTRQATARDASSITTYGEHVATVDMVYQESDDVAQGAADYLLAKYKTTFAQVSTITVLGTSAALLAQILTRDISDRLTITETVTGVNAAFFINQVHLRVLPTRYVQVTYTLAPAADPFSGLYWVLGTSTLGTDTTPAPF
jgi:hypothetical protein